ncbi:hypothetical protein [Microbacterium marinilacus]|nr:hypothetical protein [Microbacterium marinilacus]MBY0688663.1 hypothetical protein [Microbacterium marinilacus]
MVPVLPRIVITWLAIFPLVVVCRLLVTPLLPGWPDLAQTAIVMAVVVPVAVLWAVPLLTRGYVRLTRASVGKGGAK